MKEAFERFKVFDCVEVSTKDFKELLEELRFGCDIFPVDCDPEILINKYFAQIYVPAKRLGQEHLLDKGQMFTELAGRLPFKDGANIGIPRFE